MIRLYIMLFIIGIIGSAAGGAYLYYKDTQERIRTLQENNAKLEIVAKTNQETIENLQANSVRLEEENKAMQAQMSEAEKYRDELLGKLQKHDLSRLSLQKPGLIEERINNGTRKIFDALESISGASNP